MRNGRRPIPQGYQHKAHCLQRGAIHEITVLCEKGHFFHFFQKVSRIVFMSPELVPRYNNMFRNVLGAWKQFFDENCWFSHEISTDSDLSLDWNWISANHRKSSKIIENHENHENPWFFENFRFVLGMFLLRSYVCFGHIWGLETLTSVSRGHKTKNCIQNILRTK